MTELSRVGGDAGRMSHPFSARNWSYRGVRGGDAVAAYNLAMEGFNRGDLQDYRRWLRRAARMGDEDAALQLKRFETRLPHETAYESGRGRPWRRRD
ncbi:MAG TPA: hypothetical protein VF589_02935 [Allosphingosinicella sp.]